MPVNRRKYKFIEVGEAFLVTANENFPLNSFSVTFKRDMIPQATVVPAIGRSLFSTDTKTVKSLQEGLPVDVVATINGTSRILLRGYISNIAITTQNTVAGTRTAVSIGVRHQLIDIAGAPAAHFALGGSSNATGELGNTSLSQLRDRLAKYAPYKNGPTHVTADLALQRTVEDDDELDTGNVADFIYAAAREPVTSFLGPEAIDRVTNDVLPYEGCSFGFPGGPQVQVARSMGEKFASRWRSANAWTAMTQVARQYFLSILPFNTGCYIANPNPLLQQPALELSSDDVLNVATQEPAKPVEPTDGIILEVPASKGRGRLQTIWSFPENIGLAVGVLPAGKYYKLHTLPEWCFNIRNERFGPVKAEVNKAEADRSPREKPVGIDSEDRNTIANRIAKAIYSEEKSGGDRMQIKFPYRQDIMPGTLVSFKDTMTATVSFIGDTLYGMVDSVNFQGDMSGNNGSLVCTAEIVGVRGSETNKDLNRTFPEHPIYSTPWVGMDLNGILLESDQPSYVIGREIL